MDACIFSTETFKTRDQRDAWSDWFQPVFDVIPEDIDRLEFTAHYKIWTAGEVKLAWTAGPAARSVRDRSHLRRSRIDHWVISLCRAGPTAMQTQGRQLEVPAGVPYVWSLGHV